MKLNVLQQWEIKHQEKIQKELKQAGIELTLKNIQK